MRALQKTQGRTDQALGAMADMLTSVTLPRQQQQQWVSEARKERLLVAEEAQNAEQGDWGPGAVGWERGSSDSLESSDRPGEGKEGFISLLRWPGRPVKTLSHCMIESQSARAGWAGRCVRESAGLIVPAALMFHRGSRISDALRNLFQMWKRNTLLFAHVFSLTSGVC
ncbi:hypothetical protein ANANG_G00221280 [Anguilla anguilla]|uniref:Uncharacterized protein n=1 Tax=Anguilla anguilla TaxID=7936 RepID=A0A9D3LWC4_ANGAN|nr:hypothetical protein ANANG_G00221280 [Anguilla anguilla]